MAQALFYSSNAVAMTLAAGIASGDTTCNLSSTSGLPASFPFKLLVGWGTAQQEVVHCTALSGVVATITRGQDGTTAQAHSIGATVVHGVSAREFNDLELHVGSSAAVHGITGSVVGTTDAQPLTNKTFDATSTVSGAPLVGTTTVQTLTNKTLSPPTSGTVAAVVKGLSGQSVDLQQWQDFNGNVLAQIDSGGKFASHVGATIQSNLASPDPVFTINIGALGLRGMVLTAASGQTASLIEWYNGGGGLAGKVDASGNVFAPNLTNAWTAYTPTFTNCTSPTGVFRYLLMGKTLFIRASFTGGTATATAAVAFSLPAGVSAAAAGTQDLTGNNGTAAMLWQVAGGSPNATSITSVTAGTALINLVATGVVETA